MILMSYIIFYLLSVECLPQQVHLAFGDSLTAMVIMWSTHELCSSHVHYGEGEWNLSTIVTGRSLPMLYTETPEQTIHKSSYLHRVNLTVSASPELYIYICTYINIYV